MSSSIAELIAAYSPPIPRPVQNRNRKNHHERQRRHRGGGQVHPQGDHEQVLPAETVGEPTKEQRSGAGSGDVQCCAEAGDLRRRDVYAATWLGKSGRDIPDNGYLEPVEYPHRAEADDDHPVPSGPRQPIQPRRDFRGDRPLVV
jgi:hypothetical protein